MCPRTWISVAVSLLHNVPELHRFPNSISVAKYTNADKIFNCLRKTELSGLKSNKFGTCNTLLEHESKVLTDYS